MVRPEPERVQGILSVLAKVLARGLAPEQRRLVLRDIGLVGDLRESSDEYSVFNVLQATYSASGNLDFAHGLALRIAGTRSFYQDVGTDLDRLQLLLREYKAHDRDEEPPYVFAILPFTPEFLAVYETAVRPCLEALGCRVAHVQDAKSIDRIIDVVFAEIARASFLVADVTGRNANVFYELGYAHGLGKQVILLVQSIEDVPFDTSAIRHIVYKPNAPNALKVELKETASIVIAKHMKAS